MPSPEELTPELKIVLDYVRARPCQWLSVRDVRIPLGLTNGACRYRLTRLWRLGYITRHLTWITRPHIRRIWFHFIPKLYRIKIRLYTEERKPTPEGAFQGWFDIDARLDPDTGLVDWSYWLTQDEIEVAKYHFIGYWKGMAKWREPEQIGLAYFLEKELAEKGILAPEKTVAYKEPTPTYAPNIPAEFIERAQRLNMKTLIVGESSVEPKPVTDLEKQSGVFFEKVMIIKEGTILWHEERNRWAWRLPLEYIERVKSELGIK